MNELYLVSQFIITKFQENPMVNTVTFEKTSDIDLNKENIYPISNIDLIDSIVLDELITFNFIITVIQQRDIDNELNNDKLFGSNLIDNLNETHSIAVRFINNIRKGYNDENIDIESVGNLSMVKFNNTNLLDGVRFNLAVSIPNNTPC